MKTHLFHETPVGRLRLESEGGFLTRVERVREKMESGEASSPVLRDCARQLDEYFAGKRRSFDLPLKPDGTPYQKRVWSELCRIPYGETLSYRELAERVADARHCRSVAQALHDNPLLIVYPCHRVIGRDGSLTGFGAGLPAKALLLELEKGHRP